MALGLSRRLLLYTPTEISIDSFLETSYYVRKRTVLLYYISSPCGTLLFLSHSNHRPFPIILLSSTQFSHLFQVTPIDQLSVLVRTLPIRNASYPWRPKPIMSSWFNFWSSPLKGDAHEERPKISWVSWHHGSLIAPSNYLHFFQPLAWTIAGLKVQWRELSNYTRSHLEQPSQVLRPLGRQSDAGHDRNLEAGCSRRGQLLVHRRIWEFTDPSINIWGPESCRLHHAVQVHNIGVEYHFTELRQLASERITVYGDNITLVDIVKILSEPPFKNVSLTGSFRDYVYRRANQQDEMIPKNVQTLMNGSIAGILCERIARLESEKKQLNEALARR